MFFSLKKKEDREQKVFQKAKLRTSKRLDSISDTHDRLKKSINNAKKDADKEVEIVRARAHEDLVDLKESNPELNATFVENFAIEQNSTFSKFLANPIQEINSVVNATDMGLSVLREYTDTIKTYCSETLKLKQLINNDKLDDIDLDNNHDNDGINKLLSDINNTETEINDSINRIKEIEQENRNSENKKSLSSWPMWLFFLIMGLLGIGEFGLLYTMLHSQEAGLNIDKEGFAAIIDMIMAAGGALALLIVLVLLSHSVGLTLKQTKMISEKLKVIIITASVLLIFGSITIIRSDYHNVDYIEKQVEQIQETIESKQEELYNIIDSDDEEVDNTQLISIKNEITSLKENESNLRAEARNTKKLDSLLFIFISIGYFLAGAIMGYYVHPGIEEYEILKKKLKKLKKHRNNLEKEKTKIIDNQKDYISKIGNEITQETYFIESIVKELKDTETEYTEIIEYILDQYRVAITSYFDILYKKGIILPSNYDNIILDKVYEKLEYLLREDQKIEFINKEYITVLFNTIKNINIASNNNCQDIKNHLNILTNSKIKLFNDNNSNEDNSINDNINIVDSTDYDAITGRETKVIL